MKKPAIIAVVVLVVAGLLLHWQDAKLSKFDSDFRQNLPGTWSSDLANMHLTTVVMPDGSFTSELIFVHAVRTNTYQETGTWVVKDGNIIETVKSDTNPTALAPRAHAGRIIRSDAHGFAVRWQGSPDEWVWQKVIQ